MRIKCNFLKKIGYSFNPSMYSVLGFQSAASVIGYVFLFTFLTVTISLLSLAFTVRGMMEDVLRVGSIAEMAERYVPEFTMENGELDLSEAVNLTAANFVINIDSSVEEITMSDVDYLTRNSAFTFFVIGSKKNVVLYNVEKREYQEYWYSDYDWPRITKDDLLNTIVKKMDWAIILGCICWYLFCVIGHYFVAGIFFLLMQLVNLFMKRQATGAQMYTMTVFSVTPWLSIFFLLNLLSIQLPGELINPIYFIMTMLISIFALYYIHLENTQSAQRNMNPYRIDDVLDAAVPRGPSSESMEALAGNDLSGYASMTEDGNPGRKARVSGGAAGNKMVKIMGVSVSKDDLEVVDKYIQGNLKDMAASQLQSLTNLSNDKCMEIVKNWYSYY